MFPKLFGFCSKIVFGKEKKMVLCVFKVPDLKAAEGTFSRLAT